MFCRGYRNRWTCFYVHKCVRNLCECKYKYIAIATLFRILLGVTKTFLLQTHTRIAIVGRIPINYNKLNRFFTVSSSSLTCYFSLFGHDLFLPWKQSYIVFNSRASISTETQFVTLKWRRRKTFINCCKFKSSEWEEQAIIRVITIFNCFLIGMGTKARKITLSTNTNQLTAFHSHCKADSKTKIFFRSLPKCNSQRFSVQMFLC